MKGIQNYRKLSAEEMNQVILERVPLNERLRAVYIPLIAMDCACYVGEDLLQSLRELKLDATKKISRGLKECIEGYRKDNYQVMRSDLYKKLENFTKDFYSSIMKDLLILQLQFQQALLDKGISISPELSRLVALFQMVRMMVRYVITLDRRFSGRISELLGDRINYVTEDNHYCLRILSVTSSFRGSIGVSWSTSDIISDKIEMAFKVYTNKLNQIEI